MHQSLPQASAFLAMTAYRVLVTQTAADIACPTAQQMYRVSIHIWYGCLLIIMLQ